MKRKTLCVITLICYLLLTGAGAVFALVLNGDLGNLSEGEGGIGTAIAGVAIAIIMVLAIAYAAVGILPLLLKLLHIFVDSKIPAVICIPFDIIYIVCNGALVFSAVKSGITENMGLAVFALALLAVSVTAIATNIASLSCDE